MCVCVCVCVCVCLCVCVCVCVCVCGWMDVTLYVSHARTAVRSTLPQQGCAARCVRLGMLRGVGRLHGAARVLADERTRPCTARTGLAHTRSVLKSMLVAARACLVNRWLARAHSRTFGGRERRAGFGHDCHKWHEAICPPCADFAEDGLAASQLNFTTGDARRILGCHLGVAYDTARDQCHEDRSAAPAAYQRRVRSSNEQTRYLLRRAVA
jgi:hypothetical protein